MRERIAQTQIEKPSYIGFAVNAHKYGFAKWPESHG
jgi:hypothetical protein